MGQLVHFPLSTLFFLMWNPYTSKELNSVTDTKMKAPKSSALRGIWAQLGVVGVFPGELCGGALPL